MSSWERRIWENLTSYFIPEQSAIRVKNVDSTQFGETLVAERTPIIELNSSYGVSLLRDKVVVSDGGEVTSSEGIIQLSTTSDPNSSAFLGTTEVGRYIPGYGAEIGIGIKCPANPTGDAEVRWGGRTSDELNGFYFGVDSSGLHSAVKRGGTVEKTYRGSWNIDKLDGTGPSGVSVDRENGVIYQVKFTWYGYGQILFGVVAVDASLEQRFIPCHSIVDFQSTSIQSPNLRLFAEVYNEGSTTPLVVEVGGRQYSIIGKYIPKVRVSGEFRDTTTISTTVLPLISFRQKTGFSSRANINLLLDFDIPEGESVTLCARTFTGSGTLRSAFRVTEEW